MEDRTSSAPPARSTITLAGKEHRIELPSGRKTSRAFAIMRELGPAWDEVNKLVDRVEQEWRDEHPTRLSRLQAQVEFPPRYLVGKEAEELGVPDGYTVPSRIAHITDEEWEAGGGYVELPPLGSAPMQYVLGAVLPKALEVAEEGVMRLLALFVMPNEQVKALWRQGGHVLRKELDTLGEDLIDDCSIAELLELVVVISDVVDDQLVAKLQELGDRAGNVRRLLPFGKRRTTPQTDPEQAEITPETTTPDDERTDTPSNSTETSSTDTPEPTDGQSTSPSMPPGSSSTSSPSELTTSA